jgi:HEAT repeat protein
MRRMGPEARDAVPGLTGALKDTDPQVRSAAAHALGALGSDAKEAVPTLQSLLKDPNGQVREATAAALRRIKKTRPGKVEASPPPRSSG